MEGILSPRVPNRKHSRKLAQRDGGEGGRGEIKGKLDKGRQRDGEGGREGDGEAEESAKAKTWTSCLLELTATRRDWE